MLLKYVFGKQNMEEDDQKIPVANRKGNFDKFLAWLENLDVWGSYLPLNS